MRKSLLAGIAALVIGISPIAKGVNAYAGEMKICNMGRSQYLLQLIPEKNGNLEELMIVTDEYNVDIRANQTTGGIKAKTIGKCDKKCREEILTALSICAWYDIDRDKTKYPLLNEKKECIVENMRNGMGVEKAVDLADLTETEKKEKPLGDNYLVQKDKGLETLIVPFGKDTLRVSSIESYGIYGLRNDGRLDSPDKLAKFKRVLDFVQKDKKASPKFKERLKEVADYMEKDGAKLREAIGLSNNSHKKEVDVSGTVLAYVPPVKQETKTQLLESKIDKKVLTEYKLVGRDLVKVEPPKPQKQRIEESPVYKAAQKLIACVPAQTIDYLVTRFQSYDPNLVEEKACEAYKAMKAEGLSADKYSLATKLRSLLSGAPTAAVSERPKEASIDIQVKYPEKLVRAEPKPAERKEIVRYEQPVAKSEPAKPECVSAQTVAYLITKFPSNDPKKVEEEACKVFKARKEEGLSADKYSLATELKRYIK